MGAVLETRWRPAQTEKLTPIGLVSMLVADELLRRPDRLLERRHKQGRFRDPDRSLDTFDFDFKQEDESGADPRARDRALHRATGGCALSLATRDGEESFGRTIGRAVTSNGIASSIAKPTRSSRNSPTLLLKGGFS